MDSRCLATVVLIAAAFSLGDGLCGDELVPAREHRVNHDGPPEPRRGIAEPPCAEVPEVQAPGASSSAASASPDGPDGPDGSDGPDGPDGSDGRDGPDELPCIGSEAMNRVWP